MRQTDRQTDRQISQNWSISAGEMYSTIGLYIQWAADMCKKLLLHFRSHFPVTLTFDL